MSTSRPWYQQAPSCTLRLTLISFDNIISISWLLRKEQICRTYTSDRYLGFETQCLKRFTGHYNVPGLMTVWGSEIVFLEGYWAFRTSTYRPWYQVKLTTDISFHSITLLTLSLTLLTVLSNQVIISISCSPHKQHICWKCNLSPPVWISEV